ncbi:MAG: hypothetical protein WCE21_01525 [Candidatus Babeliales bacterium]
MKMHKKHQYRITALIALSSALAYAGEIHHAPKDLPINVPSVFDGTPLGINDHKIKQLLYITKKVEDLLYGVLDHTTNARMGKYVFRSNNQSIQSLTRLETSDELTEQEMEMFRPLLHQAIEDFIKVATPFVAQARGVKIITLRFIDEWAHKHHRTHSYLLDWSREEDGKELDAFRRNVQTFRQLDEFCVDLVSFISDLIRSCPQGWQQFLETQKQQRRK